MKKPHYLLIGLFAFVLGLWLVYPYLLVSSWAKTAFPYGDWGRRGLIGDSFGALNTLFSGLALAGLAVNIYIQNSQLRKLEKREQANENTLSIQADTLRMTALLNYYNNEVDRLERLIPVFEEGDPKLKRDFDARIAKVLTERRNIVAKLNQQA